ncbi:MAG: hypothetical protein JJU36_14575 [Phycisphaeraceae bacterium]|nr:hypothetical protein [Phycisphaeraceae bacterium]
MAGPTIEVPERLQLARPGMVVVFTNPHPRSPRMIIACPNCRHACEVPQSAVGRRAACPACDEAFTVVVPKARILDDDATPEPAKPTPEREEEAVLELAESTDTPARPNRPSPAPAAANDGSKLLKFDHADSSNSGSGTSVAPTPTDGWMVRTAKGERGPFSNRQIIQLARQGRITPKSQLRHTRKNRAVPAGDVPGLFKSTGRSPVPEPAKSKPAKSTGEASSSKANHQPPRVGLSTASADQVAKPKINEDLQALAHAHFNEETNHGLSADELARVLGHHTEGGLSASGLARELQQFDSGGNLSASGLARALSGDE